MLRVPPELSSELYFSPSAISITSIPTFSSAGQKEHTFSCNTARSVPSQLNTPLRSAASSERYSHSVLCQIPPTSGLRGIHPTKNCPSLPPDLMDSSLPLTDRSTPPQAAGRGAVLGAFTPLFWARRRLSVTNRPQVPPSSPAQWSSLTSPSVLGHTHTHTRRAEERLSGRPRAGSGLQALGPLCRSPPPPAATPPRSPAVRGRAPAAVGVRGQVASQHELLVLMHERRVGKQQADVVRVESLAALGTADGYPALADL